MTTFVVLLRGVNVGGSHKLPMADLRSALEGAGHTGVLTYIQSGNVVLRSDIDDEAALERSLTELISEHASFGVPVLVRSLDAWDSIIEASPYAVDDPTKLHLVVLDGEPPPEVFDVLDMEALAPEEFTVIGRELYLHLPNGMGRSKLAVAIGRLPGPKQGTSRNWRTVLKLQELARTVDEELADGG